MHSALDRFMLHWGSVVAVLLLGGAVLISGLTRTSLWADEGWTIAATAEANPVHVITEWVAVDVHPPLFFLGLNTWRRFTGDTIFEMRYFSLLLSMVGIALSYRLGSDLYGRRAGLLAALFYALHDLVIVLTQEVRHYPQQIAFSVLTMWLYWRFWQVPIRRRGVIFALGGAALLYTHYWGGFVLLSLALHALLTRRDRLREFVLAFAGIGLLFLPWLPSLYHQITLERPGGLPHALENSSVVYATLIHQLVGIPQWFWVVLAAVGAMGAFAATPPRWKPSPASLMPLLVVVVTPLLSILINSAYPTLSFRSLAVVVPAVILLAAHGLAQFRARERGVLLVFVVAYSLTTASAQPIERPDWPHITETITTRSTAADTVLLENDTDEFALAYYLDQSGTGAVYAHSEQERRYRLESYPAFIDATLRDVDGVWVARLGWPALGDIRPDLAARGIVQTAPAWDYGMYNDRPILLWRLDRLPDGDPLAVYDEMLALYRVGVRALPDGVTVNLLWSAATTPAQEYTISAFLLGEAGGFANHDSRPLEGRLPTSTWEPEGFYFDSHTIPTADLPPGLYNVGIQVYYFADTDFTQIVNVSVDDCRDDPDCRFIFIDTITLPAAGLESAG